MQEASVQVHQKDSFAVSRREVSLLSQRSLSSVDYFNLPIPTSGFVKSGATPLALLALLLLLLPFVLTLRKLLLLLELTERIHQFAVEPEQFNRNTPKNYLALSLFKTFVMRLLSLSIRFPRVSAICSSLRVASLDSTVLPFEVVNAPSGLSIID